MLSLRSGGRRLILLQTAMQLRVMVNWSYPTTSLPAPIAGLSGENTVG